MPRNMSFAFTTPQFQARTKTVTRRFGWKWVRPGTPLMGVEKAMGLKRGETVVRLGPIEVTDAWRERADAILSYSDPKAECAREGFPELDPEQFLDMLLKANGKKPGDMLTRIAFRYVDRSPALPN